MRRSSLIAVLALASVPAVASAQMCRAYPALRAGTIGHVGVGASFFDGGKGFGAQATFGGPLFLQGLFNFIDADDSPASLKVVGAGVGYEVADAGGGVSVCPGLVATYGFGLEILGIDITTLQIMPGLAVGVSTDVSPTVSVTPYAEAALVYTRVTADAGPLFDDSEDDWSGLLDLGLGFGFNDRLVVRPSVSIPISEDNGDTIVSVTVAVGLGG